MRRYLYYAILTAFVISALVMPTAANAATQASITRSQVEQRALAMINYTWTYSSQSNSTINPAYSWDVTKPTQLNASGQMTGIPYCWGGFDSLDTASYNQPWTSFGDAVKKGAYTGNTNSDGGIGHVPGTAGLDCSGFVQAAFNIKDYKQSTTSLLNNYFTPISMSDLKHMDILDLPGDHVLIFDSWGSYNGISGAYTYECTDDQTYGGIQGAKEYFIDMDTINSGYIAARFNYIQEDAPLPYPVSTGIFAQVTDNLNFRSSAANTAGIITVIPQNGIIYISSYSNGWYKVSYNGIVGWVWGAYVAPIPSGKYVTVKNVTLLNLRSWASSSAPVVGTIGNYQYAQVLGYSSDGNWMEIKYNNMIGWSYAPYLSYIF